MSDVEQKLRAWAELMSEHGSVQARWVLEMLAVLDDQRRFNMRLCERVAIMSQILSKKAEVSYAESAVGPSNTAGAEHERTAIR